MVDRMYHNIPRFLKAITQKVTLNLNYTLFKSSELSQIIHTDLSGTLNPTVCGFRSRCSTIDHIVRFETSFKVRVGSTFLSPPARDGCASG